MTDDIVTRLHELARDYHQHRPHYLEAADEIIYLRAALATCRELRKLDALEIGSLRGTSRLRSYGND